MLCLSGCSSGTPHSTSAPAPTPTVIAPAVRRRSGSRQAVTVVNPSPGGGTSTNAFLTLSAPTPTLVLTQVSPSQFIVGSSQTSAAVFGSNLTTSSVMLWNGTAVVTSYVISPFSGTYLLLTVPASLLEKSQARSGTFGTPIFVGSEPNKLALTSDGRYLWVGLDGAGAVRKVDLIAGVAGLQFALGGNGGIYENPTSPLLWPPCPALRTR